MRIAVVTGNPKAEVLQFKSFVEQYEEVDRLRGWVEPLENVLRKTTYRRTRVRLLQYGVVVHAMIDTLDPKHYTTNRSSSLPE